MRRLTTRPSKIAIIAGHLPHELPTFLGAAGCGALLATWLEVEWVPRPWLRTLGVVLLIAGTKLRLA